MSFVRKCFIFDTSTLVSVVLRPGSVPDQAFTRAAETGDLMVSADTFGELREVLSRQAFDRYRDPQERQDFLTKYEAMTMLVTDVPPVTGCRDPKDDKFLSLVVAAGANVLISSDNDLLTLERFGGALILSPAQFLESH